MMTAGAEAGATLPIAVARAIIVIALIAQEVVLEIIIVFDPLVAEDHIAVHGGMIAHAVVLRGVTILVALRMVLMMTEKQ